MNRYLPYFLSFLSLIAVGCHSSRGEDDQVISKRYIHKYGYDVSKKEWESANYPGKIISTLHNGVTVSASYENGILNGPMTITYPHSQTTESLNLYEKGNLIKKRIYDIRGIPKEETEFLSPSHFRISRWFSSGTPLSTEEYHNHELLKGEYYNKKNEIEARVVKGKGIRITRNQREETIAKETIDKGYPILSETFHPHGIPHTITPLLGGQIHGEKKVFAPTGEPISVENYTKNILHGIAYYYQNGCLYLEVNYKEGKKHGLEKHYVDGETIIEEINWYEGKKHGASTLYFDGMSKINWYYNNKPVTKEQYRQLAQQEENIAIMNDRARGID